MFWSSNLLCFGSSIEGCPSGDLVWSSDQIPDGISALLGSGALIELLMGALMSALLRSAQLWLWLWLWLAWEV